MDALNKLNEGIERGRLDRRAAIKWMLAAAGSMTALQSGLLGQSGPVVPTPQGIGFDPNLLSPGELPWELTLTPEQFKTVSSLVDLILPRVDGSPSASELHVPEFIDEWISAPYESQREDRTAILQGLQWMDAEALKRFKKSFSELALSEQTQIADDICNLPTAKSEYKAGAKHFAKIRDLAMGGYYTTNVGVKEVGYVGNVALPRFDGPPQDVLDQVGIEKAPW